MSERSPTELAEGEGPTEKIEILAAARFARKLLLDGHERITWNIQVLDGYDIFFSAKVIQDQRSEILCEGHRVGLRGVDRSRVVAERTRGTHFSGQLDLSLEHAGCLGDAAGGGRPYLQLEFDNYFSYFTPKTITLQQSKSASAAPDVESYNSAIASCEGQKQWERALSLMDRMLGVGISPNASSFAATIGACKSAGQWAMALEQLGSMRHAGVLPDTACYTAAIDTCEACGHGELAIRLMHELGQVASDESLPDDYLSEQALLQMPRRTDLEELELLLAESLEKCPPDATELFHHLRSAKRSLATYAASHG
ncbi:unnamed protein product [Polarella glacialis]|uniref:Uncharacterized protein n=1 Tax=Polarella glacialis TaxID=89957 RepID=A0A813K5C6_POLGL|nr:unnamed protein product [Polarella glacialis]